MFSKDEIAKMNELYGDLANVDNLENGKGLSVKFDDQKMTPETVATLFMAVTAFTYDAEVEYSVEVDPVNLPFALKAAEKYGLILKETESAAIFLVERLTNE